MTAEGSQSHTEPSDPVPVVDSILDTLQAVSELPGGSVVELANGKLAQIVEPVPTSAEFTYLLFFGETREAAMRTYMLPVRVIMRG